MAQFRTKLKHLLLLLIFGYAYSLWLISLSSKRPPRQFSSKFRVHVPEPDESLKAFVQKLPLKERFEIERRYISYSMKLGQKDEYDSKKCGSWQSHYIQAHQQQQQKQRQPQRQQQHQQTRRYIVHSCKDDECGGLSERMMSAASLFVLSLLTDREFFVDWKGYPHQSILRTPFLNLQPPPQIASRGGTRTYNEEQRLAVSLKDWDVEDLNTILNIRSFITYLDRPMRPRSQHSQQARELREQVQLTPQLDIQLNRGFIQRILTDPSYSERLESMGLHQYNAYECILSFIFRPTFTTQGLLHRYRAVFKTPGLTTIGIHLPSRTQGMGGGYSLFTLEDYEHSMPCARNLSKAISIRTRNLNEKFLYVIFTDSDEMRRQVQQEYGDQIDLIFPPPPPPVSQTHPVQLHEGEEEMHYQELKVRRHGPDQGRQPWSKIMSAVDDEETNLFSSFLFSETDYQIITSTSFSKVALFRKGSQGRRSAVLMPNKRERATFEDRNLGSRDGHDVSAVKIQLPDCSSIEDAVTPWDVVASFGTLG